MLRMYFLLISASTLASALSLLEVGSSPAVEAHTAETTLKSERFNNDPGWEEWRNRITPKRIKTVTQEFAFSATNFAGKEKGEIGGTIWCDSKTAWYADKISTKTLGDRLSASGTFALTAASGSSGAFLGWFKEQDGGGRQNSLGFRFAGEGSGARLTFQLVTAKNQACGTKITPWIVDKTKPRGKGRKFRPTSIRNDGTRYTWKMEYDPQTNNETGQIQFTISSNSRTPEKFEGKTFSVDLPKGYKEHGTAFDRFGLVNSMRPGNSLTIYFDDLQYDGKQQGFSQDPSWIGSGNHAKYPRSEAGGAHDFGFSESSSFAGGSAGELGGLIWRNGVYGFYADRVGPLSLEDRLDASGKVILKVGPPDSGMYLVWFNSAEKENSPPQAGSFVGVKIGGPTRVGHYFLPAYATAQPQTAKRVEASRQHPPNISIERGKGPVLVPQKVFEWKLVYDPTGNGGKGLIQVTLGKESITLLRFLSLGLGLW